MKRCFVGVDHVLVVRCSCCNTAHADASHARIYPQEGAQVAQHLLIHTVFGVLKSLSVASRMENRMLLLSSRDLRLGIAFPAGEL